MYARERNPERNLTRIENEENGAERKADSVLVGHSLKSDAFSKFYRQMKKRGTSVQRKNFLSLSPDVIVLHSRLEPVRDRSCSVQ